MDNVLCNGLTIAQARELVKDKYKLSEVELDAKIEQVAKNM